VTAAPRLDLSRPRDVGALLGDGFRLYFAHFGTFVLIAAAVVIPANVIVSGVGLEQLTSGYDQDLDTGELAVPFAVSYLVTAPLVAAMTIHALLQAAAGEMPGTRRAISAGLDAFAPVFPAVLLAAAGVALGLLLFIVPGIYLAVRWYFVPQAVVIDRRRGVDALQRSGELVTGSWWRVFGIGLLITLIATLAGFVTLPLSLVAEEVDRAVIALAGTIIAELITAPFVAIVATLLYFDLSSRRTGRVPAPVPPGPGAPPPPPAGPPDPPGLPPREP
jgi:hypothetical protein